MLGYIIGSLGLLATIMFGVHQIILNKKNKISLSFEKKECYSLFKKDINRLNFDVSYKGKSIESYLILFKGKILNDGKLDIDKKSIYKPIQINTKNKFKWLEASITNTPNGAGVILNKKNEKKIEVKWDLLKSNEYIDFEALIEVPQNVEIDYVVSEFYNSIYFDFRITNLKKINKINRSTPIRKKKIFRSIEFAIIPLFFGLFIFFSQEMSIFLSDKINYLANPDIEYKITSNNDTIIAKLGAKNYKYLYLNDGKYNYIKISDFNENYKIEGVEKTSFSRYSALPYRITGVFIFLISILVLIMPKKQPPTMYKKNKGKLQT